MRAHINAPLCRCAAVACFLWTHFVTVVVVVVLVVVVVVVVSLLCYCDKESLKKLKPEGKHD